MKWLLPGITVIIFFGCDLAASGDSSGTALTQKRVGGPCEGCEAVFESPVPLEQLSWQDTLADFTEPGPRLVVSGKVLHPDGHTPAPGVVIYAYHTDQQGLYSKKGNETGWGIRHGYIRGWVKTNHHGEYRFYTLRPASYPNSDNPAHIHFTIKEPKLNAYYIDDIHFTDDPLLTEAIQRKQPNRAGTGIVQPRLQKGVMQVTRDIYLGKNIPAYPKAH
jgi:protocatechuate 3,4-dioxygenase beta subunit